MLLGFKTKLKVNKQQRILLAKHAGTARPASKWGLGLCKQIRDNNKTNPNDSVLPYRDAGSFSPHTKIKFPSAIDLHKWLVALVKPVNCWYVELTVTPKSVEVVGVDLGVKALAKLSTGSSLECAKAYKKLEKKLSRLQWLYHDKQIGSANHNSQYSQGYVTQTYDLVSPRATV